jgi:hypothetical protein
VRGGSDEGEGVKRAGHYILNGLTWLSLLFCIGTVVLWVRSYQRTDALVWLGHNAGQRLEEGQPFRVRWVVLCSARGQFGFFQSTLAMSGEGAGGVGRRMAASFQRTRENGWHYERENADGYLSTMMSYESDGGFKLGDSRRRSPLMPNLTSVSEEHYLAIPCWLALLAGALFPAIPAIYPRLRRRPRPGFCPRCNYDLRATPERCPECGAVPTKVKA